MNGDVTLHPAHPGARFTLTLPAYTPPAKRRARCGVLLGELER